MVLSLLKVAHAQTTVSIINCREAEIVISSEMDIMNLLSYCYEYDSVNFLFLNTNFSPDFFH